RRQAKLAARAAERAALEKDPRPYGGLAAETQLIALQEFVPSATAKLSVKGFDRDVYVCSILPGASAGMVRDAEAGGAAYVALQDFIPSATAKLRVKGFDRDVYVCSILPGASAGMVRDAEAGGAAYVALQVRTHTHNPGRDLAYALNWAKNAQPGETLESTAADGAQPDLKDLVDESAVLQITDHQDFAW